MEKNATNSPVVVAGAVLLASSIFAGSIASVCAKPSGGKQIALVGKKNEANAKSRSNGSGTLLAMLPGGKKLGQCPLQHTDVTADVSGYVARVKVTQVFENVYKNPIEAVYTFPLSDTGAVDEMVMTIGKKKIIGTIKKREEARRIYNQAKADGKVASLLDQERTNIFTQSVANIPPGEKVEITLQYVETLPYESGKYSFVFPTVVGPRFIPGSATGKQGTGRIADTDTVPDASLITPPVTAEGTRAGHDISLAVNIHAGVPITNISSKLHEVNVDKKGNDSARVSLKDLETLPNRDFVLTWDVAGDSVKSGYLTQKSAADKSGYFTLMLLPPKRIATKDVAPKEMIFLIDCSGSQSGPPLNKAKETLSYIVEHMNPQDTFQILAFSDTCKTLFAKPEAVNQAMKQRAQKFINGLDANGGTWMAPAVEAACKIPADDHRLRIVTFMTDGYVGNEAEVLDLIKKLREKSRWFSFGTGDSVNRLLIDGIAQEGGGEADYVLLNSSGNEVGRKFYDRISTPVLTDVKLDFNGVDVKEVFPKEVADVWAERPLYYKGRYEHAGNGTVTLSGFSAGKPYKQTLALDLPEHADGNTALSSMWARAKVDRLMREDFAGQQNGTMKKELRDEIVDVALKHHIMTQFTSFVAVDNTRGVVPATQTVVVPTEVPEGVSVSKAYGAGRGVVGGGARADSSSNFYGAPLRMQQLGYTPTIRDFREAPATSSAAAPSFESGDNLKKKESGLVPPPPAAIPAPAPKPSPKTAQNEEHMPSAKLSKHLIEMLGSKKSVADLRIVLKLHATNEGIIARLLKAGLKDIEIDAEKQQATGTISVKLLLKVAQLADVISIVEASSSAARH